MPFTPRRAVVSTAVAGLAVLAAACSSPDPDPSASAPPVIERPFAQGGKVTMRLSAGQYTIENAPGDHIRLAWETRDPGAASRVRAKVDVEGDNSE